MSLPTPAVLVPQTPVGRFYLSIPDVLGRIAQAYAERIGFPAGNFQTEMLNQLGAWNWTFDHVRQLAQDNGMPAVLTYLKEGLPKALIGEPHFDLKLGRRWTFLEVPDPAPQPVETFVDYHRFASGGG